VKKEAVQYTIRLLGKVAPDETRVYIINATVDGWITQVSQSTTGSLVKKDAVLASFYSPEFLAAEQALLFALNSQDRVRSTGHETEAQEDQLAQFNISLIQYRDALKNLGMGDLQVREMIKSRQYARNIDITSPEEGFIIARNVSKGLRFDKGTELYRIADLSRVWILADLYEREADYVKPGQKVQVSLLHQKRTIEATVSDVLPRFDPDSRTLKVRLEAENPDLALKPEMFVDVEYPVSLPPAVLIPADALLDSGLRQTVFIDRGNGYFEPRQVKTGRHIGDQVEIVEGLVPGDRIVSSGTFLLDSESRMKMAAAGFTEAPAKDPVCGMDVDTATARSLGRESDYQGKTYYFCADHCKEEFARNPSQYLETTQENGQAHD
jgi:membrane fusion protein, copper/silver efflux system